MQPRSHSDSSVSHPNIADGHTIDSPPSFKRWWRQAMFVPLIHSRWVTPEVQAKLTAKVTEAEKGHRGEVFLLIENHIPMHLAYHMNSRARAIDLFGQYRIWDTEENTGVLVYVNVCEHTLEIVADRGISSHVSPTVWQAMCDKALAGMAKGAVVESLGALLDEVGRLLRQYYYLEHDPEGNELDDGVVFLK